MRFLAGVAVGIAAAWAALAIWQRVPEFADLDVDQMDDVERLIFRGEVPPVVIDPDAHGHDNYCRYPSRPCVCTVTYPITGGFGAP